VVLTVDGMTLEGLKGVSRADASERTGRLSRSNPLRWPFPSWSIL